jgi:hypothetical protein
VGEEASWWRERVRRPVSPALINRPCQSRTAKRKGRIRRGGTAPSGTGQAAWRCATYVALRRRPRGIRKVLRFDATGGGGCVRAPPSPAAGPAASAVRYVILGSRAAAEARRSLVLGC